MLFSNKANDGVKENPAPEASRDVAVKIKICGMRELKAVQLAATLGVDALGFIFAPQSPRYISPEKARVLVAALPATVDAVGVFVDQDIDEVLRIASYCKLSVLQLHGDESVEYCRKMHLPVLKAIRVGAHSTPQELKRYQGLVSGFVLDTFRPGTPGGTGEVFDWGLVESLSPPAPVVLAGGLTPFNVHEAIKRTKPYAVDFNSGLEHAPGKKDLQAIRQAVAAVRESS